jgi:hypothetical protein
MNKDHIYDDICRMLYEDHKDRLVEYTSVNGAEIDTCRVYDSKLPYETGIRHREYNDGHWVIVEAYNTKEDAEKGHQKWVKLLYKKLPENIVGIDQRKIGEFIKKYFNLNIDKLYKRRNANESI